MSDFEEAFEVLIHFEGSAFENDPDDPGGATRYGITISFLQEFLDGRREGEIATVADIKIMGRARAHMIYREMRWDYFKYYEIIPNRIATALLLASVNLDPLYAHKCAQRALRCVSERVVEDGLIGPITIAAINRAPEDRLFDSLRSEVAGIYRMIDRHNRKHHPERRKYFQGLLNRAYHPD